MYALRPIQNRMLGKRRRDNVDVNIPKEPPAKRHHQHHLTSSSPKCQTRSSTKPAMTSQTRYSMRNTKERARRAIAGSTIPIPTPMPSTKPNLRKRQHTAVDADVSEVEPKAKRHHQRHLTSRPTKRIARNLTKPAVPTQTRYSLRMTPDRIRRSLATSRLSVFVEPFVSVSVQYPTPAPSPTPTAAPILASAQAHPIHAPAVVSTPSFNPAAAHSVLASTHSRIQTRPVPIQITQILNPTPAPVSTPTSSQTPVCPSISIPFRPPVEISIPAITSIPTHLAWNELPESERVRLSAQYDDTYIRAWSSRSFTPAPEIGNYTAALGLAACDDPEGNVSVYVFKKYPELYNIMPDYYGDFNPYEFCHHREYSRLSLLFTRLIKEY